jgi:hypothetical protein
VSEKGSSVQKHAAVLIWIFCTINVENKKDAKSHKKFVIIAS